MTFSLMLTSSSGCSGALGGSGLLLTDRSFTICRREGVTMRGDSSFTTGAEVCSGVCFSVLEGLGWGSALGKGGGRGMFAGADGSASSAFSGAGGMEVSGWGGGEVSCGAGLPVLSSTGGG